MPLFQLKEGRSLNSDAIADIEYTGAGSLIEITAPGGIGGRFPHASYLNVELTSGEAIQLEGEEADGAWDAYQRVTKVNSYLGLHPIERTVFVSYRRADVSWAIAICRDLKHSGYDVFFDHESIASGDFESVIIENIKNRANFLVLLTPSALERCGRATDLFRREIEAALAAQRNIVPLRLNGFAFGDSGTPDHFAGTLARLARYNGLPIHQEYFGAAMERLRNEFLNIPLANVKHPA